MRTSTCLKTYWSKQNEVMHHINRVHALFISLIVFWVANSDGTLGRENLKLCYGCKVISVFQLCTQKEKKKKNLVCIYRCHKIMPYCHIYTQNKETLLLMPHDDDGFMFLILALHTCVCASSSFFQTSWSIWCLYVLHHGCPLVQKGRIRMDRYSS